MTFAKLVSLFHKNSLWFTRVDLLGDRYEGTLTRPVRDRMMLSWQSTLDGMPNDDMKKAILQAGPPHKQLEWFRRASYINSWHMNEHESDAMWKIYAPYDGIAIVSQYNRLLEAVNAEKNYKVFIGKVRYRDYDRDSQSFNNLFDLHLSKRKVFEHEQELRALVWDFSREPWNSESQPKKGIYIKVSITHLLNRIVVAPESDDWYYESVKDVVARYGCSISVERSGMEYTE